MKFVEAYLKGFCGTLGVFTACLLVAKCAGKIDFSFSKIAKEDDTAKIS